MRQRDGAYWPALCKRERESDKLRPWLTHFFCVKNKTIVEQNTICCYYIIVYSITMYMRECLLLLHLSKLSKLRKLRKLRKHLGLNVPFYRKFRSDEWVRPLPAAAVLLQCKLQRAIL
jgi:hypothetical protein